MEACLSQVVNLPIPETATPRELLVAASRRDFEEVLVLGYYADGELRHASTMTRERELWLLELRKQQLLGIIDAASVKS
jgi:hypothetical protein